MEHNDKELVLYRSISKDPIFADMAKLLLESGLIQEDVDYYREIFYRSLSGLSEAASEFGFEGNLWHAYITYLIINDDNIYSRACEIRGENGGSINSLALHDFEILKAYFDYPLEKIADPLGIDILRAIGDYHLSEGQGKGYNPRIRDRICTLSKDLAETKDAAGFKKAVTSFYGDFGVGTLGLHKAFRVEHRDDGAQIIPITNVASVSLDDLVGYEIAKQELVENTEAFVEGRPSNNCLLYGDAGTGKSTSIKAIMNQYYPKGLRIIEVFKHQFKDLNSIISQIKNRNYRFIIYMDDLSFEEFETDYKYLKAVIEGDLEVRPENVRIYATSNRRHLIRETYSDKEDRDPDMHSNDTVQEKISLSARFGTQIYYGAPTPKEYRQIVISLAKRHGLEMDEKELLLGANQWELSHGGLSGRTAQQYIDHLLGKEKEKEG